MLASCEEKAGVTALFAAFTAFTLEFVVELLAELRLRLPEVPVGTVV